MVQCPLCHIAYFTPDHVALSPPPQILQYIVDYLTETPVANRKDLYKVFDLLVDANEGRNVDLPDPTAILPYLGLFTLVVLTPEDLKGHEIATTHLPDLSIFDNRHFTLDPNASPTAPNVARIFDVMDIIRFNPPKKTGHIPLSSQDPEFRQQRYWRLPTKIGVVLATFIERIGFVNYGSEEISLAQTIRDILSLACQGLTVVDPSHSRSGGGSSGSGMSGGCGSSTGPAGGNPSGSRSDKKKLKSQASGSAAKKSRQKARKLAIGGGESDSGGDGNCSDRSRSPPYGVHPDDWEVASSFSALDDGPARSARGADLCESSSKADNIPSTDYSNNTPSPPDGVPSDWQFGPSFSTHKIVFTARGVSLV
ncbi:hypothetical protein PILCRDRAFT_823471 [Piloderma croceum F 1598]|uniref:Uncharacterized protein n=1 Tax=Piloderma croceum (strain F 1598) TaxID=765440 RepID=A0A0C3BQF9_PILCF|nr:hypothetical protein PILCRDRAFT_823471 [Piloderma croceum F 1598]